MGSVWAEKLLGLTHLRQKNFCWLESFGVEKLLVDGTIWDRKTFGDGIIWDRKTFGGWESFETEKLLLAGII